MKKSLLTLMCLAAMLVAGTSIEAQVVTIPLNSGWTWISYPRADTLSLAAALGEFVPEEGDIIKSQYGYTMYSNGYWSGGIDYFYPGLGYMYKSMRNEPVPFAFPTDEVINPDYVPIDWDEATLVSTNDSTGAYQIQFDDELPELHSGSIITIDQDTVVHHLFVETVSVNGNTVSVTSTEAYLTDIFACTDFTLTTVANSKSSAKGKVFYPVAAYQCDEQGIYQPMDLQRMRDGDWSFTHNLWHYGENFDGEELFSGNNFSVYMDSLDFNFDLDLEMYMNFSGRNIHEIVGNAIDRYRSQALNLNASLLGTFDTKQILRCDVWGSCNYSPDSDIWKHDLFRPLRIKFMVYGVPVVITLSSDLCRQVEVTASGEISAYAGFNDHAQGRVGFEWQQTNGMSPVETFSNTFELVPPTVEGRGSVEAKAWVFPHMKVLLYNVVGPSFDFKPYLSTTLSGGFREELLGQSNDFCAWSLDCNTGLDAACGLSIQCFGYELENFSTPNWNIVDIPLYHSPKKIQKASVGSGQTRTVSFNVYDQNYLFNTEVLTPLPQFVKFEANGQLSSEYGIAQNGLVTVNWTPTNNDILYAKLYDIDGNVMSWDTVSAGSVESPHDWVDLGLPSGLLWATCNVGANAPEDYGDYFAWGETQPKNTYNWSTYQYCNGSENTLTKYCNNPDIGYNGFTDDLTTLLSEDDAATAHWGADWRVPTKEEWQELYDNTSHHTTSQNGVPGLVFLASNGNRLFLPRVGYCKNDSSYLIGSNGYYWSSSLYSNNSDDAWFFYFGKNIPSVIVYMPRFYGYSIRPVRSGSQNVSFDINVTANPAEGGEVSGGGIYEEGTECELTAIANEGYTFTNWTENNEVVSTDATYIFIVNADRTLVANFTADGGGGGSYNGHDYVDLGLPSGLLWATCNVGADNPEDYGDYFAWGETTPKDTYNWSTYQHCNGSHTTLIKYCNNSSYGYNGFTDNLTTLLPEDDAATANWGNGWRMPTQEEFQELLDNTTVTCTTQNGVNGRLFTASNGNSLFLPATGTRWDDELVYAGYVGYYWSSSLYTSPYGAWMLYFYSDYTGVNGDGNRDSGHSVRPVCSSRQN